METETKVMAVLRAFANGHPTLSREVATVTGMTFKTVHTTAKRLRDKGLIDRCSPLYPARHVITEHGKLWLQGEQPADLEETETIVESALRRRPALAVVWGEVPA